MTIKHLSAAILVCCMITHTAYAAEESPPQSGEETQGTAPVAPSKGTEDAVPQNTSPKLTAPVLGQDVQNPQAVAAAQAAEKAAKEKAQREQDAQALFEESLRQMMPLSKEQIQDYRVWSDQRDKALMPVAPSLRSRTVRVSLEPGAAPVVVNTTASIATSLVFHDATGQPWPITSVTNGGPQGFQVLRPELPEGNLINVMPISAYASANLVVTLSKQDIPLVIRLQSDSARSPERKADGLVLFQLAHFGPNAQAPITKNIKETASSVMLAFLDHVPPADARRVRLEPKDEKTTLWALNDTHYLRTTHSLIWPAWTAVVNGAGGIRCYEMPVTPRIVLSRDGVIETIRIKGGMGK